MHAHAHLVVFRPVCESLPHVQRAAHCQEEDAHQEANSESGLQRIVHLRPANDRSNQHGRVELPIRSQPRVRRARLGPDDEERGRWTPGDWRWFG